MSILKYGALAALVLTLGGAAPAYAHKDGIDWINMMQRLRAADGYAQERTLPKSAPSAQKSKPGWQFKGGPKGGAVWSR